MRTLEEVEKWHVPFTIEVGESNLENLNAMEQEFVYVRFLVRRNIMLLYLLSKECYYTTSQPP